MPPVALRVRKKKKRSPRATRSERISWVRELLSHKGYEYGPRVKEVMEYFKVGETAAAKYLKDARAEILKLTKKTKEEWTCESLEVYRSIVYSGESEPKERIVAQKCIDKLLGLEAPKQVHVATGIVPMFTQEQQQRLLSDPDLVLAAAKISEALAQQPIEKPPESLPAPTLIDVDGSELVEQKQGVL